MQLAPLQRKESFCRRRLNIDPPVSFRSAATVIHPLSLLGYSAGRQIAKKLDLTVESVEK